MFTSNSSYLQTHRVIVVSYPPPDDDDYHAYLSTDFLFRFAHEKRLEEEAYVPLIFDNYSRTIQLPTTGQSIELGFQDTTGQHAYENLRIIGYDRASVFVCLFHLNHRSHFESMIQLYLPEIRTHGPSASIILVGCFPEKRDQLLHEHGQDIVSWCTESMALPYAVASEEGRNAVHVIEADLQLNLEKGAFQIQIAYLEFSPRCFHGFNELIDLILQFTMKRSEELILYEKKQEKKKTSFLPIIKVPSLHIPFFQKQGKKVSKPSTTKAIRDALDQSIMQILDKICSPVDEELLAQQERLLESGKVLGVAAASFSILRLLHNIHSNTLATRSIVIEIIIPATRGPQCPYFYYLLGRRDSSTRPLVGQVSVFLSHAWDYRYSLLEELAIDFSTVYYFQNQQTFPYYWCDLFIKNQHSESPVDEEFLTAIRSSRLTVGLLNEIQSPLPLTRIWCLFEYFHTLRLKVPLQLFFPLSEALEMKEGYFANYPVDVRTSNAKVMRDKERILKDVEELVGIDSFNQQLQQLIGDCCPLVLKEAKYRERLMNRFGKE